MNTTTTTTTAAQRPTRRVKPWLLAPLAVAGSLALSPLIGATADAAPTHAAGTHAAAAINKSNTYKIGTVSSLAAGATRNGYWNNTPMGRSYFVDVRPGSSPSGPCAIEVTREYRVRTVNGSGNPELEVHWQLKNVGSVRCGAEVWLGYVA